MTVLNRTNFLIVASPRMQIVAHSGGMDQPYGGAKPRAAEPGQPIMPMHAAMRQERERTGGRGDVEVDNKEGVGTEP